MNNLIIFNKTSEDALVGAAVMAKKTGWDYVTLDKVDFSKLEKYETVMWLGCDPKKELPRGAKARHSLVFLRQDGLVSNKPNVVYCAPEIPDFLKFTYNDLGITEKVALWLQEALEEISEEMKKELAGWLHVGYLIKNFCGQDLAVDGLSVAWYYIEQAYDYLFNERETQTLTESERIKAYQSAVSAAKNRFVRASSRRMLSSDTRGSVAVYTVSCDDVLWYAVKRLLTVAGQYWAVPQVRGTVVTYQTNTPFPVGFTSNHNVSVAHGM